MERFVFIGEDWIRCLSGVIISLADSLVSTPRAQTTEEVTAGEDPEEESPDGCDEDFVDSPHAAAATTSTINAEAELEIEKTQLDRSFSDGQ